MSAGDHIITNCPRCGQRQRFVAPPDIDRAAARTIASDTPCSHCADSFSSNRRLDDDPSDLDPKIVKALASHQQETDYEEFESQDIKALKKENFEEGWHAGFLEGRRFQRLFARMLFQVVNSGRGEKDVYKRSILMEHCLQPKESKIEQVELAELLQSSESGISSKLNFLMSEIDRISADIFKIDPSRN